MAKKIETNRLLKEIQWNTSNIKSEIECKTPSQITNQRNEASVELGGNEEVGAEIV